MEEAIVSLAIGRIADLLIQEAVFLNDVSDQVQSLKNELERMKSFLNEADRKQDQDQQLRTRAKQIRDLAYNAEDAIDSFILKFAHQKGFHGLIKRFKNIFAKPSHLHKIGKEVKAIKTQLEDISKSKPAYEISREVGESSNSAIGLRRSYPDVEEDDVVSLDVPTKNVIDLLLKDEDRRHVVVSIVGMGGLGKTTLAKKVYNHTNVKRHFDCCAWAFISQQCLPRDVFHGILTQVLSPSPGEREQIDKLKEEELVVRLQHVLNGQKYLVVLDDIWRDGQWDIFKNAFPRGNKGSKLLFTTRNTDVPLYADPCSSLIELPFLTVDKSWELLRRKAMLANNSYPEELEVLGREMSKKCGGLPLAIVVLGGLLANKKSSKDWEKVRNSMDTYLNKRERPDHQYGGVYGILVLSYNELPFHLKPCFLYLSQFPEDSEISKKELIRLWIAEGFVPESKKKGTYMEDIAEEYLQELINRCLVHVGRRDHTGRGVKTCRIHDMLRAWCVLKVEEQNFLKIINPPKDEKDHCCVDLNIVATAKVRQVAVHLPAEIKTYSLEGTCPNLRSLLLFCGEKRIGELKIPFGSLRFLRVLKLSTHIYSFPNEIGDLIYLKYFALGCAGKVNLPRSIVNLKSLYTLVIRAGGSLVEIGVPNVVFKLEHLRHLKASNGLLFTLKKPQELDTNLRSVETLKYIKIKNLIEVKVLLKLSNIHDLGIMFERSEDVETFLNSFKLDSLQSLSLELLGPGLFPNLEPFSKCDHLSKLSLRGVIPQLSPQNHVLKFLPKRISKLYLSSSEMKHDPMVVLEKLPHLRSFYLGTKSYTGSKLRCSANGFPELTELKMFDPFELEEWEIEEGAMPRLEVLELRGADKLRMIPEGLKYVTSLQELTLESSNGPLVESIYVIDGIDRSEGKDYYKIGHIPTVKANWIMRGNMEEAILSLAIERIADLLIQEAFFLNDVRDQVESLKAELQRMKSFLKEADRKQDQDQRLQTWVKQIRDLAYDAEDAIDSFILKVAHQRGFHGLIKRFKNIFAKPFHLHKIGKQVKAIQTKLEGISERLPAYEISTEVGGSSNSATGLRRSYPDVDEDDVVGLEESTKDVIDLLMKDEDRLHVVVSIVGMGGLGKTTLAKKVYNHTYVKRHFDYRAWVFISQQCLPRYIFRGILTQLLSPSPEERKLIDELKEKELIGRLQNVLKEKLYLVVLDDIWRCEDWDSVKAAFPRGTKGSKLLFTTRIKDVSLYADPYSSTVELPFLTAVESWELLNRKAILTNNAYPEEWEVLGKKITEKCGGLPLAIVLLGGLLATKKSLNEWMMVLQNMNAYLNKLQRHDHHYVGVHGILVLCYNELPYHLKPCFLYLSQYPEDSEISKKELIRLWIAEGLVSESKRKVTYMEDIAEEYLEELINRCLVHVGRRDHTGRGVKTCRIHDLLRDLCVSKVEEENFLRTINPLKDEEGHCCIDLNILAAAKIRRVAVHLPEFGRFSLEGTCPSLRSLLLFSGEEWIEQPKIPVRSLRFLRVLKLSTYNCPFPNEIGDLIHLRYFALRCVVVVNLPRSIVNLKSLHTFLIRTDFHLRQFGVPNVVFKIEYLRHLETNGLFTLTKPQVLDTNLESIETLKFIEIKNSIEVKLLLKLSNIRDLGVVFKRLEDVETFLNSFNLGRLRSLSLHLGVPFPNLEPLSHCHHLSKLSLRGTIPQLKPHHHALKFVPNYISKLTLDKSLMEQDPMVVLEKLPQLRSLILRPRSYTGSKLCCSANGFPVLTKLHISDAMNLEEWEIEEGAMPHLEVLELWSTEKLRMIPEGLRYVTTLEELNLKGRNRSLVESIEVRDRREGEDYYKVRHIPTIKTRILD